MVQHDAPPPFIHPHLVRPARPEESMESLMNCMSIMHLATPPNQGSKGLFWKMVSTECERMREEVSFPEPNPDFRRAAS
jgi:hypothetical protein